MSEHHMHKRTEQDKSGCCGGKHESKVQDVPKEEQPKAAPAKGGCCG